MITVTEPSGHRASSKLTVVAVIAAVMLVIWLITAVAMMIWTAGAPAEQTHHLAIPAGTRLDVDSGRNPLTLPSTWSFFEGDTLIMDNQDRVAHQVGGWLVEPGTVSSVILRRSTGGALFCSLHPSGEITVDVQMRGFDWPLTLVPTLLAGLPLGLAAALGMRVWPALDDSDQIDLTTAVDKRREQPWETKDYSGSEPLQQFSSS